MPPRHEHRLLVRTPLVAVTDTLCRDDRRAYGGEERNDSHELSFVRTGLWEREVEGVPRVVDPRRVALLDPAATYRARHPVPGGDRCTGVSVAPRLLRESLALVDPALAEGDVPRMPWPDAPCDERAFLLQDALLRHAAAPGGADPLAVEEAAGTLVVHVLAAARARHRGPRRAPGPKRARTRALHRELAEEVRRLLVARHAERLTLDDVAAAVCWSPFHLARLFRRETGRTIHAHLTAVRLRHALERVAGGEGLTGVALATGFASHSHLSDAFRRAFGAPPSAFRGAPAGARLREMRRILEA